MPEKKKRFCEKCRITKNEDNFYKSNNLEKYPEGYLNQCKDCITMHVNNWDPDTFMWILQECDVPYVPEQWNQLLGRYGKDPSSLKGTTIIGRYLSAMKLNQFKKYRWQDTKFLQDKANHDKEEAMKRQGFSAAEIAETIEKGSFPVPTEPLMEPPPPQKSISEYDDYFDNMNNVPEDTSIVDALTDEDKLYLRMKWGKAYKPDEWVQLEKLYNDMMSSYDIQGAGHEDTLKLVCKTSLKSNQLLDMGDVEGAQKMVKMYDMLMKSGKFTASQNKAENGEYVDSVSELVAMCEKDGFIPRYYTDGPQDKVDRTLQDLQKYTRTLVTEEMNLGNLIEQAIKQIQIDKEKEALRDADAAGDDDAFEAELFDEDKAYLEDEDFQQLKQLVENDVEDDEDFLASLLDEEDLL